MSEGEDRSTPEEAGVEQNGSQVEKISIVDVSDSIEGHAVDTAEERLTARPEDTRGLRGRLRSVWKHNWLREYYRNKEVRAARQRIVESGNLYVNESEDKTAHDQAMAAIADRFTLEYDEAISKMGEDGTEGEKREILDENQATSPEERTQIIDIKDQVRKLIKDYATGVLPDKEAFDQDKVRVLTNLKGAKPGVIERGDLYADNLWLVANKIRTKIEREENKEAAFERLNLQFDVYVGKAKEGVRTEAQFSAVDRIVKRIHENPLGQWANEATIASGVALAYCLGAKLSQAIARKTAYAAGAFVGGAVVGAVFGGMAEAKRTEEERKKHLRDVAKSKGFDLARSPRRAEMERYKYDSKPVATLIEDLQTAAAVGGERAGESELTSEQFRSSMSQLAEVEARVTLSDRDSIDMISYSGERRVEIERCDLAKARYQTKSALRRVAAEPDVIPAGMDFDSFLESLKNTEMERLSEGARQRNEEFKKFKRARAWKAGIKGLAVGAAIGAIAQEARAFFDDRLQGGVESWVGQHDKVPLGQQPRHTFLQQINRWLAIGKEAKAAPETDVVKFLGHTQHLPKGTDFVPDGKGGYDLVQQGADEPLAKGLTFDSNGDLTGKARAILRDSGVYVEERKNSISSMVEQTRKVGAGEVLEKYKEHFDRIHRRLWYDNNTPGVYDRNELKLWWGGSNGVDPQGNVVFNVSHMTPDGSYHHGLSTNAERLISGGRMKMLFSMSRETQKFCYDVPVDRYGNAMIDRDSDIIKVLFKFGADGKMLMQNGHPVPNFRFCEAAQVFGPGKDGCENFRILATYEGPGISDGGTITEKVPVVTQEHHKYWSLPDRESELDIPFMPPMIGRSPLEPVSFGRTEPIPYYFYGSAIGPDGRRNIEAEMSERLKKNRDAELNHFQEAEDYLAKQDEAHIKTIEELTDQAGPMKPGCRLSICIPAAGHQEGKAIYHTLESFTNQTADRNSFEIAILVNHPNRDPQGNPVQPDETLSEIERFKRDHPEMNVRVMYAVIPIERAKIGYVRKLLNDSVLLSHHQRGESVPDLIMVSNDADNRGVAKEYVQNFIELSDNNPKTESFLGQLDWDTDSYLRNPLIHIGTRLFQYIEIQSRHKGWYISSAGANFAFRSSIYAAVGGYSPDRPGGEDTELGERLKIARDGSSRTPIAFAGNRVSRLFTSSRRAESAMQKGMSPPIAQWERGFSAFDDDVRKVDWEQVKAGFDFDKPDDVKRFVDSLEVIINQTITITRRWGGTANDPTIQRAVHWLGVKFEVVDEGTIRVTDATTLINGLKEYKQKGYKAYKEIIK